MLYNQRITLISIAYNEEKLIGDTLDAVPEYVDTVLVVDDASTDSTPMIVEEKAKADPRINFIRHKENRGPGGAIISGYMWFYLNGGDVAVVVGGDNQMDQSEMWRFIKPIAKDEADYCKGNRFLVDAFEVMPWRRLLGNISLSVMTVLFSGYWSIFDTQDGYTSISRTAVGRIDWSDFCEGYGYVSDFIIRMKAFDIRIADVPRRSIYLEGVRQSQIKIGKYMKRFFPLWLRALVGRISQNYSKINIATQQFATRRREIWMQLV